MLLFLLQILWMCFRHMPLVLDMILVYFRLSNTFERLFSRNNSKSTKKSIIDKSLEFIYMRACGCVWVVDKKNCYLKIRVKLVCVCVFQCAQTTQKAKQLTKKTPANCFFLVQKQRKNTSHQHFF